MTQKLGSQPSGRHVVSTHCQYASKMVRPIFFSGVFAQAWHSPLVAQLDAQKHELQQRVHAAETLDSVARQARQLGYIRPGEHLFIIKGIKAWEQAHSRIGGGGR